MIEPSGGRSARSWSDAIATLPAAADWPPDHPWTVVAPHPDDEVLGVGGALALAGRRRGEVHIVTVTDGEAAWPEADRATREALATRRRAEAVAADRALGVRPTRTFLGLPDGAVASRADELVERLAPLLDGVETVAVVLPDDGHPDHDATGWAVDQLDLAGRRVVRFGVWAWNWDADTATRLAGATGLDLDDELRARKARAIDAHASQVTAVDGPPILPRRFLGHHLGPREVVW